MPTSSTTTTLWFQHLDYNYQPLQLSMITTNFFVNSSKITNNSNYLRLQLQMTATLNVNTYQRLHLPRIPIITTNRIKYTAITACNGLPLQGYTLPPQPTADGLNHHSMQTQTTTTTNTFNYNNNNHCNHDYYNYP